MDTPTQESTGPLTTDEAGAAFAAMLEPQAKKTTPDIPAKVEPDPADPVEGETEEAKENDESDDAAQTFTFNIDGKDVELTLAQIAAGYKSELRQADYTKKTMATAGEMKAAIEQRRTADAETAATREERQTNATNLQRMAVQLEGALQQQESIDWQALIDRDPVEYLKQKDLFDRRQTALHQNRQQQQHLYAQHQAEQQQLMETHAGRQREELLAKLPDWKDPKKASAERDEIKAYLIAEGYGADELGQVADHRAVLMARKAMLYDRVIADARAAAKKVATLPSRVERPGVTESNTVDKRGAAYQRHAKVGTVESAAAVFAGMF